MINNLLKNFCLITFALIAPITLPAGGIQKSLNQNKLPSNTKEIISPMPGLLVSVDVNVGDLIDEGQRLCAIEAMKMENVIYAERSGTIKSINFKLGDILSDGDTILEFE